ncbi:fumarate hydratase C-terminal domain-containing protein [Microaerobacter geothermalis]|uniref:fumarate hydratase C-terminal domain-containing protein n=1 Tax=Microaerobacter geothermalis TaxID=674972 RepID=UPI001F315F38|nr:fumarate hydratase C-terminal domain-containing protein [Microaerobacter geothermalis]MCF6092850.1 fumarate hydratase C-terminal domain-containing protein [Microaerobacter geothermalis]
MQLHQLHPPFDTKTVESLKAGDIVEITGTVYGVRDANLIRLFQEKVPLPKELKREWEGAAVLHTAPSVRKDGENRYVPICVGTTTSTRMGRFTEGLMTQFGIKAFIGKGGFYEDGAQAIFKRKGVYLSIVGGAAALETTQIEAIEGVWWEDLIPEAIWKFRVNQLGPLIVSIDSHGGNLYQEVKARAKKHLTSMIKILN